MVKEGIMLGGMKIDSGSKFAIYGDNPQGKQIERYLTEAKMTNTNQEEADYVFQPDTASFYGHVVKTIRVLTHPLGKGPVRDVIPYSTIDSKFDTFMPETPTFADNRRYDLLKKLYAPGNEHIELMQKNKFSTGLPGVDKVLDGGLRKGEVAFLEIGPTVGQSYFPFSKLISVAQIARKMRQPDKIGSNYKILSRGMSWNPGVRDYFKDMLEEKDIDDGILPILSEISETGKNTFSMGLVGAASQKEQDVPLEQLISKEIEKKGEQEKVVLIDGSLDTIDMLRNSHAVGELASTIQMIHNKGYLGFFFARQTPSKGGREEIIYEIDKMGIASHLVLDEIPETGILAIIDKYNRNKRPHVVGFDTQYGYPVPISRPL